MIDRQATQPKDRDNHKKILKILKCTFGLIEIGEKYFEWWARAAAGSLPPAGEATIKVICQKLADEGGQPTRGSSEDEDEYWDKDKYEHTDEG